MAVQKRLARSTGRSAFPMEGKDALHSRPWKQRQSADEIIPERGGYTALSRQALSGYYMSVNCWPARRLCWPVIGRQKRGCARENGGAIRNAELRMREPACAALSAFLHEHIGLAMFSAGNTLGAARPQTCAKEPLALWTLCMWFAAEYLLPNMAIIAIPELPYPRPAVPGYTERPCRVQFMLGRVGLYSTKFSCLARQQVEAAQPPGCVREAVWLSALPTYLVSFLIQR